ncbi:hypothetical protein MNBD_GAMMA12-3908 [hydrothermal vent metagenome]|uniref:Uncharacterized protein n=1 Tax=hydrothermal vent metagenome TaxID=652676 RepID=A0A3B0XS49_9ZZZZ
MNDLPIEKENMYYKHSGAIGMLSPVLMIILGAIGIAFLGGAYAYLTYYIPFIYLNFFIALGYGLGVGMFVGWGASLGKCRKPGLVSLIALVIGVVAAYAGWVIWIYASLSKLLVFPDQVWALTQAIADKGAWSIESWTPKGAQLNIIWGIEVAVIALSCTLVAYTIVATKLFCEPCNKWISDEKELSHLNAIDDKDQFVSQLERGNFSALAELGNSEDGQRLSTLVTLSHCESCGNNYFMSLKSVITTTDSDGKEKTENTDIAENLIISAANYKLLTSTYR